MSARNAVIKKINQRVKELKQNKEKSKTIKSYKDFVFDFFENMQQSYILCNNEMDYSVMLDNACKLLDNNLKQFDAGIKIEIKYNEASSWQDLRVSGVKIIWSSSYLDLHPEIAKEEYVDLTHMVFDMLTKT